MVSTIGINLMKLSTDAQLQTFPYPTASYLYSNAFMAKSGAQSLTFKSVTNKQTNRQTRNRKHRRAAAKPAACAKPLMLSTLGSKGREGEVGKEVWRDEGSMVEGGRDRGRKRQGGRDRGRERGREKGRWGAKGGHGLSLIHI